MAATLGISLYSSFYPKLTKKICLSYYFFNKIREEGGIGSTWMQVGVGLWGGGTNNVFTCEKM
jgi:hypothetical protein